MEGEERAMGDGRLGGLEGAHFRRDQLKDKRKKNDFFGKVGSERRPA